MNPVFFRDVPHVWMLSFVFLLNGVVLLLLQCYDHSNLLQMKESLHWRLAVVKQYLISILLIIM